MLTIHQVARKLSCNRNESLEILEKFGIKTMFKKLKTGRGTFYCDIDMDRVVEIRDVLKGKRSESHLEAQNEAAKLLISLLDRIDYGMVTAASERAA